MKSDHKSKAISLRRKGLSYSEILAQVPVAKSSLSLWLRDVGLAGKQVQRLTDKKRAAQLRGGAARREARLKETDRIFTAAREDVSKLSKREMWLVGAALYWAEGSKEKSYRPRISLDFANTDPNMVRFFVQWLMVCCDIPKENIYAHLYIHEYQKKRVPHALKFWSQSSGLHAGAITGVYFKRHNPTTRRHNASEFYYGTLRVRVKCSTALVRKIQGWTNGICAQEWEVV